MVKKPNIKIFRISNFVSVHRELNKALYLVVKTSEMDCSSVGRAAAENCVSVVRVHLILQIKKTSQKFERFFIIFELLYFNNQIF